MWLLNQASAPGAPPFWEVVTARHPGQFLRLAAPEFQRACVRMGGLNRYGRANYRVVWAASAYELAGDWNAHRTDEHGNIVPIGTVTCAVPKYPNAFADSFVLEHWKPKEFYLLNGRRPVEFDWKGLATLEKSPPIPAEGDYEAVEMAMGQPFCMFHRYRTFQRPDGVTFTAAPMTTLLVEAAIRKHWDGIGRTEAEWFRDRDVKQAAEKREAEAFYRGWADEAVGPYGSNSVETVIPHSGYRAPVQVDPKIQAVQ